MSAFTSGDNIGTKYLENPIFDGVLSPITTQGEVTLNCRAEHGEMTRRRANMGRLASRAKSYPGGDVIDNLHIMPHELVFGWVNRQGRNQIPGHPNQIGFTSLNGLKWGDTSTDEELELRIRFIGLAKTPFIFDNVNQLKHGFSAIGVGSGTTFHTGEEDIFPGDKLYWSVIPRPKATANPLAEPRLEGGKYGDSGPGSRQGNPRIGTPRGKLRFRINPSRFNDMRPSINAAVSAMNKPMAAGGIADRPYEHLFSEHSLGQSPKPTPLQEYAMASLYSTVVKVVRGVRILQMLREQGALGNVDLNTVREVPLCEAIGIFSTDPAQRGPVNALINGMYLGLSSNNQKSRPYVTQLRNEIQSAFTTKGRPIRRETTASRYVQVATNCSNIDTTAHFRAAHFEARKRFATALCFAKPGQRLDVLIGHFLESF